MKTLTNLADDYLEQLRSRNFSSNSLVNYRLECRLFLAYLKEHHRLDTAAALLRSHLAAWRKNLARQCNPAGRPLAARTVNRKIAMITSFLRFLAAAGFLQKVPSEVMPRMREPQPLPAGVMPHAKVRKILAGVEAANPAGCRDRAILELLYTTGVRAAELVALDTGSVHFEAGVLSVSGKGGKDRVVPVGRTALRHLETYLRAVRPFLALPGAEPDALFLNARGERFAYHSLRAMVHKHCDGKMTGVNITPHSFRRSCTTELIRGGANLYHVKDLLGHERLDTLKHYTRLTITDLKKTHQKCHPREKDA
jgi:site-specific recombinase XerD